MQPQPNRRRFSPTAIVIVPLAVALVMTLFAWPSARLEPRDLPVGVAGPATAVAPVEQRLAAADGSFDVHRYADEASARRAVEDRDIYGAVAMTATGPKVLTASAASRTVAQMLARAANEAHRPAPAATAAVQDVVPDDEASSALPSSVLPLVIAGSIAGLLTILLATGFVSRLVLLATGSVLGGLAANVVLQSWLDVVGGDWAGQCRRARPDDPGHRRGRGRPAGADRADRRRAGGRDLGAGRQPVLGRVVGSRADAPAGGRHRPAHAARAPAANLLRSTGFFDGAAAGGHVAVLAAWAFAGLAALLFAGLRGRRRVPAPVPQPA